MTVELLEDGRKRIRAPLTDEDVRQLEAGDVVLISGVMYAARDAAHKLLVEMLNAGRELPFDPTGQIVYYVGPSPEKPGHAIGSAGPTTASRMDTYTPRMLQVGLKGIVGKGGRGPAVREALQKHTGVYMAALGGGGALAALQIRAQKVIAFPELGPEAIRQMEVEDFPVWVIDDCRGQDFYGQAVAPWRKDDLLPEEFRLPANA
ncbi:MAG TPA: FumA C-terminus/TtdB family hydratase beta subunit [Actinomycetota bacterium]|nr:FumA C-terminus/TtdB family hydratase beta subunit [Actinomycetota bacterium]